MLLPLIVALLTITGFEHATSVDCDLEGNIYVVDRGRHLLIKYSPAGDSLAAVGGLGRGTLQFDEPVAVVARRGSDVYVADRNNHRIQRFDRNLDYVSTVFTRDDADDRRRFGAPADVAVTRQGDLLIVDTENRRVLRVDALGQSFTPIGDVGAGRGRLIAPSQVEVDGRDFVYVLDLDRIAVFDAFGSYVEDLPLPSAAATIAVAVADGVLCAADSGSVTFFDLERRAVNGARALPAPPTSVLLFRGRLFATEPKRLVEWRGVSGEE